MKMVIKNKTYIFIALCIILIAIIASVCIYNSLPIDKIYRSADHIVYNDFDELYTRSDLVIIGEETKDFSDYKNPWLKFDDDDPNKEVHQFYTLSNIKVLKVIKGDYKEEYVPVAQGAAIIDRPNKIKRTMLVFQGISPMQKGMKYLLFLVNSDDKSFYGISGINEGKVNIDGLDQSEITDTVEKDVIVHKLRPEILEKMKDQIQEFTK